MRGDHAQAVALEQTAATNKTNKTVKASYMKCLTSYQDGKLPKVDD